MLLAPLPVTNAAPGDRHTSARVPLKTRDQLYTEIRDREYGASDRALDVRVSSLRGKLGDDPKRPRFIRTVRSAGYMLVNPDVP